MKIQAQHVTICETENKISMNIGQTQEKDQMQPPAKHKYKISV